MIARLWTLAGTVALLVAVAGIFLPLIPTTPFVLLAAGCFSKGSPRLEAWLLAHPRLGPPLRRWREHRAVPRRAKLAASATMAASCTVSSFFLPGPMTVLPWIACAAVAAWLWRRPES